jgi:hypothetical protein
MVHVDSLHGAPPFKQFAFAKMRLPMRTRPARPLQARSVKLSELAHPWRSNLQNIHVLLCFLKF